MIWPFSPQMKRKESQGPYKNLFMNVHCCFICNSFKLRKQPKYNFSKFQSPYLIYKLRQ